MSDGENAGDPIGPEDVPSAAPPQEVTAPDDQATLTGAGEASIVGTTKPPKVGAQQPLVNEAPQPSPPVSSQAGKAVLGGAPPAPPPGDRTGVGPEELDPPPIQIPEEGRIGEGERIGKGGDDGGGNGGGNGGVVSRFVNSVFGAAQVTYVVSVVLVCALPALAIFLFSGSQEKRWPVFAVGVMMAAAGFLAGGLLGFLFALPRSTTVASTSAVFTVRPNTNLENVSDWLTTLIVGITLIQIGKAEGALRFLFTRTGEALGGGAAATTFSACLLVYCAACGLMGGWVGTRLFIGRWMQAADQPLEAAQRVAEAMGNPQLAADLGSERERKQGIREQQ